MRVKVLGAHNVQSRNTANTSLVVDDILAVDAGNLAALSLEEQLNLQAALISHAHYDHIRDLPALAINLFLRGRRLKVFTHQDVIQSLTAGLLNGHIYPQFHQKSEKDQASLDFNLIHELAVFEAAGYQVKAVPVNHSIPELGYEIRDRASKAFFFSGDTGPGLSETWKQIEPQVLFIEVTAANHRQAAGQLHGHLCASLLKIELDSFKSIHGYLPRVVSLHTNPQDEDQIKAELREVVMETGASIQMACEGMVVEI